jgi:hypothetical protein
LQPDSTQWTQKVNRERGATNTPPQEIDRLVLRHPIDPAALLAHRAACKVFVDGAGCTERDLRALGALPRATHIQISRLRVSLDGLADLPHLQDLHLVDPGTLEGLEELQRLVSMTVYHFPKIHSLTPIGSLTNLKTLLASTPPSYDASRKCHNVESLSAIGRLSHLEALTLRGVLPGEGRLDALRALKGLKQLGITHVYAFSLEDYARLARALPNTIGNCLRPYYEAHWAGTCRRGCGRARVALTAPPPRSPRTLCPDCDRERLERHVVAWMAVVNAG